MPPPTPARLWLVRHGQTDWNVAGRIQGQTPTELNADGRAEALTVAQILAHHPFTAIYSSDLPRAAQTAAIIAAPLHLPITHLETLRERSFGQYEGATSDQIRQARLTHGLDQNNGANGAAGWGGDLANWTGMPGIESNDQLWQRVDPALRSISDHHPNQDVLIITHGGIIARAVYRALGIPDSSPRRFALANGIVAILQYRPMPPAPTPAPYLLSLADLPLIISNQPSPDTATAHLAK